MTDQEAVCINPDAPPGSVRHFKEPVNVLVSVPSWWPHRIYLTGELTPEDRVYPGTMIVQCYKCNMSMTLWTTARGPSRIKMLLCEKCKHELTAENAKVGIKD